MSLLIPTYNDYTDAHEGSAQQEQYYKEWEKLKTKRNDQGRLEFPWDFEVVQGFFKQSDPNTNDEVFNYATDHMGRLKPWSEIISRLSEMNRSAPENVEYKLLFLARHGNGYHNFVVEKYGIEAWSAKYHSMEEVDGIRYAPDPELTELGIAQAEENHQFWVSELNEGAPIPSKFYVSPLQRSCKTLQITWKDLKPQDKHPLVVEKIRETIGLNLCDKRSSKSKINERFGKFGYNTDGITEEEDVYFTYDKRETMIEQSVRVNEFLQQLFESDCYTDGKVNKSLAEESTFISTHSHAGTIRCFLNVIKHRNFTISTGGMIPVVIKGTRRY
ncbi:PMU1 [Candida oxycetoniae]|uniref:PMU1 n=1 Tax=Candida oxycetoniae TaxID=497107 RepID=A0AAI9WW61_9ASCO|nr:PMU1 [Candida oxycetoniae]KAI3402692.2 PMU1 [Candida oxycetoniae]